MSADLRSQLLAIRERHGHLTAEVVVDEARDPSHPLHERFEWDDAVAAEAHRRDQARALIRSVKVYREPDDASEPASVRAFYAVQRGPNRPAAYEPLDVVVEDDVVRQLVLRDMERDWSVLRDRYGTFLAFVALVRRDLGLEG